jgi:hypothetical protein
MPSLPAKPFYQDGDYTTPVLIWTSPRSYPLASENDVTTYLYRRRYLVAWASYTPTARGTPDPLDASAYLVDEEVPAGGLTPLAEFERTYCRLPPAHSTPGSLVYALPPLPLEEELNGTSVIDPFYNGVLHDRGGVNQPLRIYTAQPCVDNGLESSPTGGTFTLYGGDLAGAPATSALAYNASTATIAGALNALSTISGWGSVTVTGAVNTNSGLTVTWPTYSPGLSINTSSLTTRWGHAVVSSVGSIAAQLGGYRSIFEFGTNNSTLTSRGIVPTLNVSGVAVVASSSITDTAATDAAGYPVGMIEVRINAGVGNTLSGSFVITIDGVSATFTFLSGFVYPNTFQSGIASILGSAAGVFGASYNFSTASSATLTCYYRPKVTGGTYTLTIHGQTTAALAHDSNNTQIQSALNALSNVSARGGVVSTTNEIINSFIVTRRWSFELVPPRLRLDPASLTGPSSPYSARNNATNFTISLAVQNITFSGIGGVRTLTLTNHGLRAGMTLAVKTAGWSFTSTGFTVLDENRIAVDTRVEPFRSPYPVTKLGRLVLSHTARAVRLRSSAEVSYYLTGPAPAAVPLESIQPEALQLTPERFYESLTAGETTIVFDESDVQTWRGPIYSKTLTTISLAGLT